MIISRTPFRVSFVGGGTDLPCYYRREGGAVISAAIDRYVYLTVNRRFDDTLRISYAETEIAGSLDQLRHPLFRETMRHAGVVSGVELTSIADIPSGTGLGSSSAFTVGLLHSLEAYKGCYKTADELAQSACYLEIEVLREPIGKQDQYASAFGGLRRYRFNSDGSVYVDPVICSAAIRSKLQEHLLFFYVGGSRDARQVLGQQNCDVVKNLEFLRRIRGLVDDFWAVLTRGNGVGPLGEMLHEAWSLKKRLAVNISNGHLDDCYQRARRAGALGGKVLGAGMGGFLMLFCEPKLQPKVRESLPELREVQFAFEPEGSKIIYFGK